jgi:hypothetical protein
VKIVGGPRTESYVLYALAGALLAGGPVWHYLYVNHYPFYRPEAALLVLGAALAGAAAAVVAHRIGGLVETAIVAGLLFLFVDLQFDLHERIRAPIMLALLGGLALLVRARRALLTCITLGAFYLAALPRPGAGDSFRGTPGAAGTDRPLLLHLILDEQWGVGGLRAEGDSGTAAFLTDFYQRHGFEVYPAAYSRYYRTVESIPGTVSLGEAPSLAPVDSAHRLARTFVAIPYFALLRERGYGIRVYQNSYLNFCRAAATPVQSCETQSGNSIANIGYLRGTWTARARLAGRYMLNLTSHVYRRLQADPEMWRRSSAGGGLQSLRRVRDDIAAGPGGATAYFVHVLLPHRPLEVDERCGAVADPARRVGYEQPPSMSDSAWAAILERAGAQIRCTHVALAEVLAAIDSTVGRENSVVLVHGDHGGRIFQHSAKIASPVGLDDRQLNGRYSTLLAVRRPGVPSTVNADPVPVQDFVWRLARQAFKGPVGTEYSHYVRSSPSVAVVADSERVLTRAQMPWARP